MEARRFVCIAAITAFILKARTATGVAFAGAFAAMIVSNYAIQTTLVPALATAGQLDDPGANLVAMLTMANPRSLGWALEMWGYAVLGVATWLVAPVLIHENARALDRVAATLFVVNGPASILTALATAFQAEWVHSVAGLASFAAWNVIVLTMTLLVSIAMRPHTATSSRSSTNGSHASHPVAVMR